MPGPLLRRGGMGTHPRAQVAARLLGAAGRLGDEGLANDVLGVMAGAGARTWATVAGGLFL